GVPLTEQRIAVLGAGSAGTGICALLLRAMVEAGLSEDRVRACFYLVDRPGLLLQGMKDLQPFQAPFAQAPDRVAKWTLQASGRIGLQDVVANAHPTVLIGTSGQAHAFTQSVVGKMADHVKRPVIFPLSNPTDRSEATPAELAEWTQGRAVIATGSPVPPLKRAGRECPLANSTKAHAY